MYLKLLLVYLKVLVVGFVLAGCPGCFSAPVAPPPALEAQVAELQRQIRATQARIGAVELQQIDHGARVGGVRRRMEMAAEELLRIVNLWRADGSAAADALGGGQSATPELVEPPAQRTAAVR